MQKNILCIGYCVLDRVYELMEMPQKAEKIDALNSRESGGGPAATAAVAIASLGGKVSFLGYLGDDLAGKSLMEKLSEKGVDVSRVIILEGVRTVAPVVLVNKNAERCIIVHRQRIEVPENKIRFDLTGLDLLLVDSRWIKGALKAVQEAKKLNIPVVVDIDGGSREDILSLLKLSDHAIFSEQGLLECTKEGHIENRLHEVKQFCPGIVAVTVGSSGSYWLSGKSIYHIPAFQITPHDTTGCGDVFHGTYALGITEGMSPLEAAYLASGAAALKAINGNGWDGMPHRLELEKFLENKS